MSLSDVQDEIREYINKNDVKISNHKFAGQCDDDVITTTCQMASIQEPKCCLCPGVYPIVATVDVKCGHEDGGYQTETIRCKGSVTISTEEGYPIVNKLELSKF